MHSGKKRAEQTASIFAAAFTKGISLDVVSGIGPMDDVKTFAQTIDPEDNLMVVGHLPFMPRLVSYLIAGSDDMYIYKFQNSGIICLDWSSEESGAGGGWFIKWTLNPNIS